MSATDGAPVLVIPRHMMDVTELPPDNGTAHSAELPNSQESATSAASSTFSAPGLPSSSSNLSNSTVAETDFKSTVTSYPSSQNKVEDEALPRPPEPEAQDAHLARHPIDAVEPPRTGNTTASPMPVDSPVFAQGSKRTASGMLKGPVLTMDSVPTGRTIHKRNKSMEARPGGRIGELSAQLKTRLSYAMVKVQNGWEKKSLDDLEDETSQLGSPVSGPSRSEGFGSTLDSPRDVTRRRRPSALSEISDQVMLSPGLPSPSGVSRSSAATPSAYWQPQQSLSHAPPASPMVNTDGHSTALAPAVEIAPRRKRRSSASFHPPSLLGPNQKKHYSDLGPAPSRTVNAPQRPGILRMPSQQAEKDAVDTLLFLSSPNNAGRLAHTSSGTNETPKRELPARRVMFENHIMNDHGTGHLPMSQPNGLPMSQPNGRSAFYHQEGARS
ncbi:uncharacterized protein EI97DRAFT_173379 [Westerdykella ornata]|uniref:Cyclin-dependent kinase n=1 Tax=Westerdykella ornata TaxID=318751 RepID=A0A6A6JSX6_WESOR|nr:uncharacterized protein EI97DRAFT_173379 [Westerdykella ornata]KAF2279344.1 hypothetical protein EI97DRAFT_173379 [Westerdykella ornata]